ncbi:MAG: hypothetical protein MPN21_19480 [Thermoanaerobaculia bacterium]|nr:hypothetical protein [Thermoanaerobaculia bacterium]
MSRSFDKSQEIGTAALPDEAQKETGRLLRDPVRPMPESLRARLLAIPVLDSTQAEEQEIDRLYAAALAARTDENLDPATLHTSPIRATVVRLLAAVIRDARSRLPLPEALTERLHAVRRTMIQPGRRSWRIRWVTETRWAAVACWLLAFAFTLGTDDAVAGLLDAPTTIHARSSHWAQRAGEGLGGAWSDARTELHIGYGLVRSRAVALGAQAEAWSGRAVRDVGTAWSLVSTGLAPQVEGSVKEFAPKELESNPTNPGDPSPEEVHDDR